jgi:hypothetical protein
MGTRSHWALVSWNIGGIMKIRTALALTVLCLPFAPVAVMANEQQDQQDQQDRQACMIDAQTVCGQFIPDRERVAQCLMSNRSKISPECREALKHFK